MAAGDFTNSAVLPTIYAAARKVSAERAGSLDAIDLTFDDKGAAVGDTVKVPYTGTNAVADFVPAAYGPLGVAATAATVDVSIAASKKDSWSVSDEQQQSLMNSGNDVSWFGIKVANSCRVIRNAAATACDLVIANGAGRAVGTVGTTPFASDMTALVAARRVLSDVGAPLVDLQLVAGGLAYDNLLNLDKVNNAAIAGSDMERRTGTIRPQYGFNFREDAFIATHTCGTGTSYQVDGTQAVRDTSIILDSEGSGTILAGDFVTLSASDTVMYGVKTGITAATQTLVLNRPGLFTAKSANDVVTVIGASSTFVPTLAFERSSVVGIMRPPKLAGDGSVITTTLFSDDFGLTYMLVKMVQYGITTYEVHLAYGFSVVNEHVCVILG